MTWDAFRLRCPLPADRPAWSGNAPSIERGGLTFFFRRDGDGKPIEDAVFRWVRSCEIPDDAQGRRELMGVVLAAEHGKSVNPNTRLAAMKLRLILDGLMTLEGK